MSLKSSTGHDQYVRLKASLLGVVGSFVLFAAYLAIPPLGIFAGVLAPFPATYNYLIHGRISSLMTILGATAAITALFGVFAGSLYLGECAMIGFLMPELLLRSVSGSRVLFWTTGANLVIFFVGFIVYGTVSGTNLQQLISAEISSSMKQAITIYEKAGVSGGELELLKRSMATGVSLIKRLYPSLVTAMLVVIAGCNLALFKKINGKSIMPQVSIDDFGTFRNPDMLVWLLIAAGFAILLPESHISTPALNILMIVTMLYFFQGMAVVTTFVKKSSFPTLVKMVLYTMLLIQPYLLALIAGIGLFDLWVDFRIPRPQDNL